MSIVRRITIKRCLGRRLSIGFFLLQVIVIPETFGCSEMHTGWTVTLEFFSIVLILLKIMTICVN